jgi:hypothetical protein
VAQLNKYKPHNTLKPENQDLINNKKFPKQQVLNVNTIRQFQKQKRLFLKSDFFE